MGLLDGLLGGVVGAEMHAAFGSNVITSLAAKVGMDPHALAAKLAQALPQAVNKLTPNGVIQPS